jgi:hypothetical protein
MSPNDVSPLALEEYRALRATIRERGSLRTIVIGLTVLSWAALTIVGQITGYLPVLGLVTLLVLVAGFEIVYALHVGVERIGRYLQARYETGAGLPGWEHAAMALGTPPALRLGVDPLATGLLITAAILNLLPTALVSIDGPVVAGVVSLELLASASIHLLFIIHMLRRRRLAGIQRERDLHFFRLR